MKSQKKKKKKKTHQHLNIITREYRNSLTSFTIPSPPTHIMPEISI